VAAEGFVIRIRGAEQQAVRAERGLVLQVELARRRVGAVGCAEGNRIRFLVLPQESGRERVVAETAKSFCQSIVFPLRVQEVRRLVLVEIVHRVPEHEP
jgi:hypothetical protein